MDRRIKRYKIAMLLISCIFPLVLLAWLPLTAYGGTSSDTLKKTVLAAPGAAAPSPSVTAVTPDPTMTALEKKQLILQVDQLSLQDERSLGAWIWNNGPVFAVLITILAGLFQYLRTLRNEQRRRIEDHFYSVIDGLAGERTETRVRAAIMLRTFLKRGYKQFHVQVFDLTVASLRPQISADPEVSLPSPGQAISKVAAKLATVTSRTRKPVPSRPELPTPLNQALTVVFKESLPLARAQLKKHPRSYAISDPDASETQKKWLAFYDRFTKPFKKRPRTFRSQDLDATGIRLDNAYLVGADLNEVWLPGGSLVRANLLGAELNAANLAGTNLTGARLNVAKLKGTNLREAVLTDADLTDAFLEGTNLTGAILSGTHPEAALSLKGAKMRNVVGLSDIQRQVCKDMQAIVEDTILTN
jgi:hypothetical protein